MLSNTSHLDAPLSNIFIPNDLLPDVLFLDIPPPNALSPEVLALKAPAKARYIKKNL